MEEKSNLTEHTKKAPDTVIHNPESPIPGKKMPPVPPNTAYRPNPQPQPQQPRQLPQQQKPPEKKPAHGEALLAARNHLGRFFLCAAGILVFTGLVALTVFFISVHGAEQTMVPDIVGKQLTSALLELQAKELYPRIQLRYSNIQGDAGEILEQDPASGTIVKAGRRIRLVVSQGVLLSSVDNYIGQNIEAVRMDLKTIITPGEKPLLTIREPLMYQNSMQTAGTILEQNPPPGTGISGPTILDLVVSRGPETELTDVPTLTGLSAGEAVERLNLANLRFDFSIRTARARERPETIVSQNPASGIKVKTKNVVSLETAAPLELPAGEVYHRFSHDVPASPYPLPVSLYALAPDGTRTPLATAALDGGNFSFPCRVKVGTTLVLTLLNKEIYRETVEY